MATDLITPTYQKLVTDIADLYESSRRLLAETYWRIGQLIVEVEQDGQTRAGYGDGLLKKLSEDLIRRCGEGFSVKNLERMRMFYLTYPKSSAPTKLAWTQYVELIAVTDHKIRRRLEKKAEKENLSSRDIHKLAREQGAVPGPVFGGTETSTLPESVEVAQSEGAAVVVSERPDLPLRRPQDLSLDTYRLVEASEIKPPAGHVLVDLGFYVYFPVTDEVLKTVTITEKPAYAYPAYIERVVDGDTLIAEVEIGFKVVVRERLRLRGINAPEMGTAEGDRSKRFLEDLLRPGMRVVVRSYRTDAYGRFVADIFFRAGVADPKVIARDGIFVNQDLLDRGLAVRMV